MKIDSSRKAIQMIRLLRENGRMKGSEIAERLGLQTNRNISRYKDIIQKLGFNIVSKQGYYGGYEIEDERLTEEEIKSIETKLCGSSLLAKIIRINDRI